MRTCAELFQAMPAAFQREEAAGLACVYLFDLTGEGGGKWFVKIDHGQLAVGEGDRADADVTITASARDYAEIAEGRRNPMLAMAMGRFKIRGDVALALKLQSLFRR